MAHIDRGYISMSQELQKKTVKKFRHYTLDEWSKGNQILGGLQPIVEMERDVANTFRPYKSWGKVAKDFAQPLRGIGNGILGVIQIIGSPCYLLYQLTVVNILAAVRAQKGEKLQDVGSNTTRALAMSFSWMLNGISDIIRGATQIAATPLSWIKMIVRGFSTLENRGFQRLVDDRNIRRLVKQAEELTEDLKATPAKEPPPATIPLLDEERGVDLRVQTLTALNVQLQKKYEEAEIKTGNANKKSKNTRLPDMNPAHFDNWLSFFQTAIAARKDELADIKAERKAKFGRGAAAA